MLSKSELARYNRNLLLGDFNISDQENLKASKVLIVGCGGLGNPVALTLTGIGIGIIGVVDYDIVETSNLQRQLLFKESDIGINKAIASCKNLKQINSNVCYNSYPFAINSQNALKTFKGYDVIVDCTDNIGTRYLINDIALKLNLPIVYGSIYKYEVQVSTFNYKKGPTYRCLFPNPSNHIQNCADVGVMATTTQFTGNLMANEVLKVLRNKEALSGKVLHYNLNSNEQFILEFERNEQIFEMQISSPIDINNPDYSIGCESILDGNSGLNSSEFTNCIDNINWLIIDVREKDETPRIESNNLIEVPINELNVEFIKKRYEKNILVICKSGSRSEKALKLIKSHGLLGVFHLKGGIDSLKQY